MVAMKQIYMTLHNIMCQCRVYAFTGQDVSNSPSLCKFVCLGPSKTRLKAFHSFLFICTWALKATFKIFCTEKGKQR